MAAAAQNINNLTLMSIPHSKKLTGSNFTNWHQNLRIALRFEKKLRFVEQPMAPAPDLETTDPKTIDRLHEKDIPKKVETPVVLSIREGRIQKDKKNLPGAKGKDKGKNKLAYALMTSDKSLL
nr:hypothetical protein [Tanacetum cinerariifolium]